MGLISKIKEGLTHSESSHSETAHTEAEVYNEQKTVAKSTTAAAVGSANTVLVPEATDVIIENKVVDVPIDTTVAEVDKTVIQQPVEEVQVKQAEAIVKEKKDIQQEVEITPVVDRVVDETEVRQTILPVKDEVVEESAEHRVMATDKRNITEAPTEAVKAKYQEQANAVQASYKEVEGEATVHVNKPVIEEVHKKHIVEEIQPVIERTTHHTHRIHTTQPIEEHVIAAAKVADIQVKAPITMEEFKKTQLAASSTTTSSVSATGAASSASLQHGEINALAGQTATTTGVVATPAVAAVPVPVPVAVEIREE